jgi:hypothetical protein
VIKQCQFEIPLQLLFASPTIADMAAVIGVFLRVVEAGASFHRPFRIPELL